MQIKHIESDTEWQMARAIRQRVFIEEQACPPEEEWDAYDESSRHVIGFEAGRPVATARWRVISWQGDPAAKLERFAVVPEARGNGLGRALVAHVIANAEAAGFTTQVIHAQAHLRQFYASLCFEPEGDIFMEAGIPHVLMVRRSEHK